MFHRDVVGNGAGVCRGSMVQHVNYGLTRNRPIFPRILMGSAADTIIGWNDSTCWMIFSESCGRCRADVVETNVSAPISLHGHLEM